MKAKVISSADLARCPKFSLLPAHYRDDGSCRCDEREALTLELDQLLDEQRRLRERVAQVRARLAAS